MKEKENDIKLVKLGRKKITVFLSLVYTINSKLIKQESVEFLS